jgi:hypothetical protein
MCPPVIYCGEASTKPFVYAGYYSILLWSHQEIEILEMTCCTQNLIDKFVFDYIMFIF